MRPGLRRRSGWFGLRLRSFTPASVASDRGRCASRLPSPGTPVTFWAEIRGPLQQAILDQLGHPLRRLHDGDDLDLVALEPWAHIPERIEQVPVGARARQILRDVLHEVQNGWAHARFQLESGVIHGDAHLGDVVRGVVGSVVVIDLGAVCIGPRETPPWRVTR